MLCRIKEKGDRLELNKENVQDIVEIYKSVFLLYGIEIDGKYWVMICFKLIHGDNIINIKYKFAPTIIKETESKQ